MISFAEVKAILDDLTDDLPQEIFRELNGGILLLPEVKRHPQGDDLYIMGQYHWQPNGLGRYITIYYGSFIQLYGTAPSRRQVDKLREVLYHELTHHLEYLAGDSSLVYKDQADLRRYAEQRRHKGGVEQP